MSIWLCFTKPRNWHIIKSQKLFGVTARARKVIKQVKQGDLLVFYVTTPINGIVAVYEAMSKAFKAKQDIPYWGKTRYPFRIRIKPLSGLRRNKTNPIPLSCGTGTEVEITPFFKDTSMIKISPEQIEKIQRMFKIG